jgi:hypothetical protein
MELKTISNTNTSYTKILKKYLHKHAFAYARVRLYIH